MMYNEITYEDYLIVETDGTNRTIERRFCYETRRFICACWQMSIGLFSRNGRTDSEHMDFCRWKCNPKPEKSDGVIDKQHGLRGHLLTWEATEEYPETKIIYDIFYGTGWYVLVEIEAEDIAYKAIGKVKEPNAIIRLKMAG